MLTDLNIKGRTRKVIMQAPKNGIFYVLDRVTGEFISAQPFVQVNWTRASTKRRAGQIVNAQAFYDKTPVQIYPTGGEPTTGRRYRLIQRRGWFTSQHRMEVTCLSRPTKSWLRPTGIREQTSPGEVRRRSFLPLLGRNRWLDNAGLRKPGTL
jgi:hypothetical protein